MGFNENSNKKVISWVGAGWSKNISHYLLPWSISKAWTGTRSVLSGDPLPTSSAPGLILAQSTVNKGNQSPKLLVAFSHSSEEAPSPRTVLFRDLQRPWQTAIVSAPLDTVKESLLL